MDTDNIPEFDFASLTVFETSVIESQQKAQLAMQEIKNREAQIEKLKVEIENLVGQANFFNGGAATAQRFAEERLAAAGLTIEDYNRWKKDQANATTSELVN